VAPKPVVVEKPKKELRPYQREAIAGVHAALESHRSTLLVMPTGVGKGFTLASVVKDWPGRCLVLAHREELISQLKEALHDATGERVDIEKAAQYASEKTRIVVGCVPTMKGQRLQQWPNGHFSLVVVDEVHHCASKTYLEILAHFPEAKVLGLTATPDRGDKKALGRVLETVAYQYDIADAIRDQWLVPIIAETHEIDVDLSGIKTVAGDLNQGQLDEAMGNERVLEGVALPTMERAGDRSTIVFTTSVANAHAIAAIMNAKRPDCARAVDGGTRPLERMNIMQGFRDGEFQFLVNVGIATEGFDAPRTACIAIGRPTKSRALYVQMVGRGLRLFAGKKNALLLDFAGNGGKHDLCTPEDILGGDYNAVEKARAKKLRKKNAEMTIGEALETARATLLSEAEAKLRAKRKVTTRKTTFDPFAKYNIDRSEADKYDWQFGAKPMHANQKAMLEAHGINKTEGITQKQAEAIIEEIHRRRREGRPSLKQEKTLKKFSMWADDLSMEEAGKLMATLVAYNNGQKRWYAPPNPFERAGVRAR
jgi:superfamily II DNA or RNA helicase